MRGVRIRVTFCGMDFGTDPDGLRRARGGEGSRRIEEEFRRFGFLAYRIGYGILKNREEAEDLVLDVFAYKIGPFLAANPGIPSAELGYWLHRVAKNLALDRLRGRKQGREVEWAEDSLAAPDDGGSVPALDCARLLRVLDATDRDILRRKYGDGSAWEEIGSALGLSVPQVRYRSVKALNLLRRLGNWKGGRLARE